MEIFLGPHHFLLIKKHTPPPLVLPASAVLSIRKTENLRSLPNKTDKLLLLSQTNKDFSNSAALCFTETWLNDTIPDSELHLPNFQLIRSDREAESNGEIARRWDVLLHQ